MQTGSAGRLLSCTAVSAGSKCLWIVSAEAKYGGQYRQEAKNGRIHVHVPVVYTLWESHKQCHGRKR